LRGRRGEGERVARELKPRTARGMRLPARKRRRRRRRRRSKNYITF